MNRISLFLGSDINIQPFIINIYTKCRICNILLLFIRFSNSSRMLHCLDILLPLPLSLPFPFRGDTFIGVVVYFPYILFLYPFVNCLAHSSVIISTKTMKSVFVSIIFLMLCICMVDIGMGVWVPILP